MKYLGICNATEQCILVSQFMPTHVNVHMNNFIVFLYLCTTCCYFYEKGAFYTVAFYVDVLTARTIKIMS